jgi:hypothetical protein
MSFQANAAAWMSVHSRAHPLSRRRQALDRAIQYCRASAMDRQALEYLGTGRNLTSRGALRRPGGGKP